MPCLQTKAVVTLNSFMKPQMLLLADLHFLSKRRLTRISQPSGSIYASATRFHFVLSSRQKSQIAESPWRWEWAVLVNWAPHHRHWIERHQMLDCQIAQGWPCCPGLQHNNLAAETWNNSKIGGKEKRERMEQEEGPRKTDRQRDEMYASVILLVASYNKHR